MINCNYRKYNNLVNFGLLGQGIQSVKIARDAEISNRAKLVGLAATLGGATAGYLTIKQSQDAEKQRYERIAEIDSKRKRLEVANRLVSTDPVKDAVVSDVKGQLITAGATLGGGLLGLGSVAGYNTLSGNHWWTGLPSVQKLAKVAGY